MAVHQGVAHGKILGQADHSVIDRCIAVGMVPAQHRTDGVGAFAVGLIRPQAIFIQRVEDAAVDRLQAIPDIGQRTADDDRHGIIEKTFFHLVLDVHIDYS